MIPEVGVVTVDIKAAGNQKVILSFSKSVTCKDAVGYFITRSQFLHAVYLHGAEIPADFCANASEKQRWSQPEQPAAGADRVGDEGTCLFTFGSDFLDASVR